jgi:hypothetical protein
MPLILFAAPSLWEEYRDHLPAALAEKGVEAEVVTETADPAAVDYIVYAPSAPLQDFTPFTRTKAVLNLWAGVERITGNQTLTHGMVTEHGPEGLERALQGADIVVTLLPKTAETENILNAQTLALLAPGAAVLNPGRGPLIDDDALLAALDGGQLGHATLDVFRQEPLPQDHPFWAHPRVTVTPHIAADTRAFSAARVIAENVRRGEAGEPFLHLVDRARGY